MKRITTTAAPRPGRSLTRLSVLRLLFTLILASSLALGCLPSSPAEDYPPLSHADNLAEMPDPASIPRLADPDVSYSAQFDLIATQTPVRNQGTRDTCSFFTAVALLEHLHVADKGAPADLDLSEQYAVWLLKNKLGVHSQIYGSIPLKSLEAFASEGVVEEQLWAYETWPWDDDEDEDCMGDGQWPVKCYTNGEPYFDQDSATKYRCGEPYSINRDPTEIKYRLMTQKHAAALSLPIHCQAWNYKKNCSLPTNRQRYEQGIIAYPSAVERASTPEQSHAMLLVGWDDDHSEPLRAETGAPLLDAEGTPLMDKGFFIVKNSWGTHAFGKHNPYGAGYGLVSMRYVAEYGHLVMASAEDLPEVCGDGQDNDGDIYVDCADPDCAANPGCGAATTRYQQESGQLIPDNISGGVVSELMVPNGRLVDRLAITVELDHPDPSELVISVGQVGSTEVVLWDHQPAPGGTFKQTFINGDYALQTITGAFQLKIVDTRPDKSGTLVRWALEIFPCADGEECSNGCIYAGNGNQPLDIPDGDPVGLSSAVEVAETTIKEVSFSVTMAHPAGGQLELRLLPPHGAPISILEPTGAEGPFGSREFTLPAGTYEQAQGSWRLEVVDSVPGHSGTLWSWGLMYQPAE